MWRTHLEKRDLREKWILADFLVLPFLSIGADGQVWRPLRFWRPSHTQLGFAA